MTATLETETKTITLTTAQALILSLSRQHVEMFDGTIQPLLGGIWGIYGHGNVAGIGEALWQYKDLIPFFRGQNEQGMAHAAIAYAKSQKCRRIMGVTTSIGPGATNMITAAALAHVNRLPVLLLPGDIFSSRRPDPVLQQLENERSPLTSVNDCFKPVSRYFDRIMRPEQLIASLPQAIQVLLSPKDRGPVTLAMPQDTQTEKYDFPINFFDEKIHYIQRQRPDKREVKRCAEIIKKAKCPLIIAGGGVHYSNAEEVLKQFVEKHNIPISETQAGKTSLPWDHPLNLGAIGVTGTSAANTIAREADVVICVGTRLSDFTTASKSLYHKPGVKLIGINISQLDAIKGNGEMLIGDAQESLIELSQELSEYRSQVIIDKTKALWDIIWEDSTKPTKDKYPSDSQVLAVLNEVMGEKDIVVCAAGGLPGELHKLWRSREPLSYHLEYGYSCMGYEIAGGLGVKIAHPDREVYVIVGDGSYLMLHTELLTAIQLEQKINIVLLDNRGFGCINRLQKGCGSKPHGNLFEKESVDFTMNAKSFGAHAKKVKTLSELKEVLQENKKRKSCCVTIIDTDPNRSSHSSAWWDVAIPEISQEESVKKARRDYEERIRKLS